MSQAWPWPDALDAVIAAPKHHGLVFGNEQVRVLDTHIPAGDIVPDHTHRWPAVYYTISFSDFIRRDQDGNLLIRQPRGQGRRGRGKLDQLPAPALGGECRGE